MKYIILGLIGLIITVLLYLSCTVTVNINADNDLLFLSDSILKYLAIIAVMSLIRGYFYRKLSVSTRCLSGKAIALVFTAVNIMMMFLFILNTSYLPIRDQDWIMISAAQLAEGNNTQWLSKGYMYSYPFQNGIVLAIGLSVLLKSNYSITLIVLLLLSIFDGLHRKRWKWIIAIMTVLKQSHVSRL